ncbi:flippase [Thomasclavelia sp.]|uniref:flippase n=1 Tax=Thomasclavelia sp. TaxID=3025757 RepID=UPI00260D13DA|nr:flippase [Thomasclavelia sp.]
MNKIIKNYIYNIIYQFFLIIIPLITAPYLTRVMSPEYLGKYGYINSVISIITTVGLLGLNSYGYRQIAYDRNDKHKVSKTFSEIYILRIVLLIIISIFYFLTISSSEDMIYYLIQYLLIVAQFIDISWVFIGFEDLGIVTLRNFVAKIITVIGIFLFVKENEDLWIYFMTFSLTTLITTISIYNRLKKYVSFSFYYIRDIFFHLIPSIKLFIPQIATLLYLQFDKVMLLQITSSASQVAYYDYADKIINIPLALITALGTVMMPRLSNLYSNHEVESISIYVTKTLKFALFLSMPMMIGIFVISKQFIPWYLGSEYTFVINTLCFLSPMIILNALNNIFGTQYLTATNKTKILTVAYYGAATINILLNFLLIPKYGCIGAAIATIICLLFAVCFQFYYINKQIRLSICLKNGMINLFNSLIMGILIVIVTYGMNATIFTTFFQVILGIVIYMLISYLTKDEMLLYILDEGRKIFWKKK